MKHPAALLGYFEICVEGSSVTGASGLILPSEVKLSRVCWDQLCLDVCGNVEPFVTKLGTVVPDDNSQSAVQKDWFAVAKVTVKAKYSQNVTFLTLFTELLILLASKFSLMVYIIIRQCLVREEKWIALFKVKVSRGSKLH